MSRRDTLIRHRSIPCPHPGCGAKAGEGCRMGGPAIERTLAYVHEARSKSYQAAHPRGGRGEGRKNRSPTVRVTVYVPEEHAAAKAEQWRGEARALQNRAAAKPDETSESDRLPLEIYAAGINEPLCACGRRWSQCDGSRAACHE